MKLKNQLFYSFQFIVLLVLAKLVNDVDAAGQNLLILTSNMPKPPDFNFHSKKDFLKDLNNDLAECIKANTDPNSQYMKLELKYTLKISQTNGMDKFIFEYNGTREYNQSCLGDQTKQEILKKLYDSSCMKYEEKVKFLNYVSCDASQNLECRQIGVEEKRNFAQQATPIMRCLCPDFTKSRAYLSDTDVGYFDNKRKLCVLKVGEECTINPDHTDKRYIWKDHNYDKDNDGNPEGIDVMDARPLSRTYPCVKNAFCFTSNITGLRFDKAKTAAVRDRCICEPGHFVGSDRECHFGREPPSSEGLFLAVLLASIIFITLGAIIIL